MGKFENQEIVRQEAEVACAKLMTYDEAMEVFQFESSKRLLREADSFIESRL